MTEAYLDLIRTLRAGEDLPAERARALGELLVGGLLEPTRAAALLTALAIKGETAVELTELARVLRDHMVRVDAEGCVFDSCGTGGSGLDTVNTSTLTALVLAAAGVRVAKHGNRSSSGKFGSCDLLEALGASIEIGAEQAAALLDTGGLAFLFAPRFHPALRHVGAVRRELGFRTVFNFLGPLCNPAGASIQLLGVSDLRRAPLMADALAQLGCERAMVVWGEDGLDEISVCAPTRVWHVEAGEVTEDRITPEQVGLTRVAADRIRGGDGERNLAIARALIDGSQTGPHQDLLLLNSAAALVLAGSAADLAAGVELSRELLESGAVARTLESYVRASHEVSR